MKTIIERILYKCGETVCPDMEQMANVYHLEMSLNDKYLQRQTASPSNIERAVERCGVQCKLNLMTNEFEFSLKDTKLNDQLKKFLRAHSQVDISQIITAVVWERLFREIHAKANHTDLERQLGLMAVRNWYHPAAEWVMATPWDHRDRWPEFYSTINLCPTWPHPEMKEVYMRKAILQCIQAWIGNLEGFPKQVGQALVLVGTDGGNGKTEWIKSLLPDGWVGEGIPLHLGGMSRVQESDSIAEATSYAIAELGELDAIFKASDINAVKRYLTNVTDAGREAWSKVKFKRPRTTTHMGSVNEAYWIRDKSGARRFLTIKVADYMNSCEWQKLKADVDMQQLFAQAYVEWLEVPDEYFLTEEELKKHAVHVSEALDLHPYAVEMLEFVKYGTEPGYDDWYGLRKIWDTITNEDRYDRKIGSEIKKILNKECRYKTCHVCVNGERRDRVWHVSLEKKRVSAQDVADERWNRT